MDIILYNKPLKIELTGYLLFVNGTQHQKSVRTIPQMIKTLMSRPDLETLETLDMYFMYRNVLKKDGMRYDITMIPPVPIGNEAPKTHGHYHPKSEDGLAYPEIYQVLNGRAVFIIQKKNRNGSVDVSIVSAKARDVVLIPAGYGHVTINSGDETLVLGNLVYDMFEPMYHEYDENRGAAYYYLKEGNIVQNGNYVVEKNERLTAAELNAKYGFTCGDLLAEFSDNPQKFAFLQKPKLLFKG
ncbi:MAG: glucose-6-phosphate isomerase family protein [Candidatus ainarchaeum sp.]|nr:glucose-6-phosphate isomerase family protein [Candidatus ainarchaeum sp.]